MSRKVIQRGESVQCVECWFGEKSCPHYGAAVGTDGCLVIDINPPHVVMQIPTATHETACHMFTAQIIHKAGGCYEIGCVDIG